MQRVKVQSSEQKPTANDSKEESQEDSFAEKSMGSMPIVQQRKEELSS